MPLLRQTVRHGWEGFGASVLVVSHLHVLALTVGLALPRPDRHIRWLFESDCILNIEERKICSRVYLYSLNGYCCPSHGRFGVAS